MTDKPSIIILKTIIGWPSPKKQNTGKIHGIARSAPRSSPRSRRCSASTRTRTSSSPHEVLEHTRKAIERGAEEHDAWQSAVRRLGRSEPGAQDAARPRPRRASCPTASRTRCRVRGGQGRLHPRRERQGAQRPRPGHPRALGRIGGPRGVELTTIEGAASFIPPEHSTHEWTGNPYGRVLHFGIREHAMAAILNGIVLHGNTRAFGGTFLIFSDYMRPAVRLAALMKVPSIFVWTHDSVALGEDGPTHQPIEQLTTLRAIPGLDVVRPGDAERDRLGVEDDPRAPEGPGRHRAHPPEHPGVRARRRRGQPVTRSPPPSSPRRARYILAEAPGGTPDVIFIATGSEVQLAVDAREAAQGRRHQRPRRVGALPGVVRGAGRRVPRVRAAEGRQGAGLDRGRPRARLAPRSSATPAGASRSSTSARPPTTRPCSRSSGSPPRPP